MNGVPILKDFACRLGDDVPCFEGVCMLLMFCSPQQSVQICVRVFLQRTESLQYRVMIRS